MSADDMWWGMSTSEGGLYANIARQVLDIIAYADAVETIEDLNRVFFRGARELGFWLLAVIDVNISDRSSKIQVVFGVNFERWSEHYENMRYCDRDDTIRAMADAHFPFFWSDLRRDRMRSAEGSRILKDAEAFGLKDALIVPFRKPNGSVTAVLMGGDPIDPRNQYVRAASHMLATHYSIFGHQLTTPVMLQNQVPPVLTRRQMECLNWVCRGKSSTDIGQILGISADVVDEHVAKACSRLGVRTRTQASVEASRLRLFENRNEKSA